MKHIAIAGLLLTSTAGLAGCGVILSGAAVGTAVSGVQERETYATASCSQLRAAYSKNIKRAREVTRVVDPGATQAEVNAQAALTVLRRKGCRRP